MTNKEFVNKLLNIVNNYKTVYVYGTWGQVVNNSIIDAKAKQYPKRFSASRIKMLKGLVGKGYFGFDCVGLIKGVLWGWNGSNTKDGGAKYESNGVPDVSANGMINLCKNVSTNFSNIQMGEAVWLDGHIGIYYKDGQVIECSPSYKDKVQITKLSQRKWLKHGKLPYIEYTNDNQFLPSRGYFKKGDSGVKIEKIDDFFANKVKGDYFGDYTIAIVKEFQRQNKLEQDGNIGPITLAKMKEQGFKE